MEQINLPLTPDELRELYHHLAEEAARMDDDGNEGAFDASKLAPIYTKVRNLVNAKRDSLPKIEDHSAGYWREVAKDYGIRLPPRASKEKVYQLVIARMRIQAAMQSRR